MQDKIKSIYGKYIKDAVYAASDGIVTTFAIVAGVAGASLSPVVVLILGFANVFADSISMAAGNFLGTKSESDHYKGERNREDKIFEESKDDAKKQVSEIFEQKGYNEEDAQKMSEMVVKNKNFFLDFTLENKGLSETSTADAVNSSIVTLIAFIIAGVLPLIPYFFVADSSSPFLWASVFAGLSMFLIGSARTFYSEKKWWAGGLEMLLVAGLAAVSAYVVGGVLASVFGNIIN